MHGAAISDSESCIFSSLAAEEYLTDKRKSDLANTTLHQTPDSLAVPAD